MGWVGFSLMIHMPARSHVFNRGPWPRRQPLQLWPVNSICDLDFMQCAPIAQGLLRRLVLEGVPSLDGAAPGEQGPEFLVSTPPAEDIPDLVVIVRQVLARKGEHQRLAEVEAILVGNPK